MTINKKGDLLASETVKIIIAVLCIIILLGLAYGLYGLFIRKTEFEQAKETLKQIVNKINDLKENEESKYLITSPRNWNIVVFGFEERPASCFGKNCICICPEKDLISCDKLGICMNIEKKPVSLNYDEDYNIENYLAISMVPLNLFLRLEKENVYLSIYNLPENDRILFNGFLDSKSSFLEKGKITIREQILEYVNSAEKKYSFIKGDYWEGDKEKEEALIKNANDYFKDYKYKVSLFIFEEGASTAFYILWIPINEDKPELKMSDFKEIGEMPSWPSYIIENPENKKIILQFVGVKVG